jgi:hypothetical protein
MVACPGLKRKPTRLGSGLKLGIRGRFADKNRRRFHRVSVCRARPIRTAAGSEDGQLVWRVRSGIHFRPLHEFERGGRSTDPILWDGSSHLLDYYCISAGITADACVQPLFDRRGRGRRCPGLHRDSLPYRRCARPIAGGAGCSMGFQELPSTARGAINLARANSHAGLAFKGKLMPEGKWCYAAERLK